MKKKHHITILLSFIMILFCNPHLMADGIRKYDAPISSTEKENINYVITTLANSSSFGLLMKKKPLQVAGARTESVHPLTFLEYVMTNPRLKKDFQKINGIAWTRFSSDFANSLAKSSKRNNMNPEYIDNFIKKLGLKKDKIEPLAANKEWLKLVNTVKNS